NLAEYQAVRCAILGPNNRFHGTPYLGTTGLATSCGRRPTLSNSISIYGNGVSSRLSSRNQAINLARIPGRPGRLCRQPIQLTTGILAEGEQVFAELPIVAVGNRDLLQRPQLIRF